MKKQPAPINLMENDPPEYYVARLNRQIKDVMDSTLRKHGLTLVEWRLLHALVSQNSLTICDLAQLAVIDRTVTSRLVEKLNERKLLKKVVSSYDKRFVQVSITRKGRDLFGACQDPVSAVRDILFSRVSETQIDTFVETLQMLLENTGNAKHLRIQT